MMNINVRNWAVMINLYIAHLLPPPIPLQSGAKGAKTQIAVLVSEMAAGQDIQYYYVYCVELLLTLHLSGLGEHFLGGIDETVRRVSVLLRRPGML